MLAVACARAASDPKSRSADIKCEFVGGRMVGDLARGGKVSDLRTGAIKAERIRMRDFRVKYCTRACCYSYIITDTDTEYVTHNMARPGRVCKAT